VDKTSPSLLYRLRHRPEDAASWQRFDALYRPLLYTWLRRHALQAQDADDLVQQVLEVVVRELPSFHYDPAKGRFRGWLKTILVNRLREYWRSQKFRPQKDRDSFAVVLEQLEDPASNLSRQWDREHDQYVVTRLLEQVRSQVHPKSWEAFRRLMLEGEAAEAVASHLNMSLNAVRLAKFHVLKKLRHEAAGLVD
jgi:RNA polymerase sigma-70 factor (ECF subfamily)